MKTLYAVPWYNCNLLCPHCNISKRKVEFNKDKFIKSLKDSNYDNVILFGGEPTLNWNNFTEIISTGKINSVSTNLVVYSSVFMSLAVAPFLKENNISVATSWNLKRFKDSAQFRKWICNLKILIKEDIDVVVLITLTQDLIEAPLNTVLYVLGILEGAGVKKFLFEPYIGLKECNEAADEWLCNFHDNYPGHMDNLLEKKLQNWICDCNYVYTLEPSGEIRKGCPDYLLMNELTFNDKCFTCKYNDRCKPCMLQRSCSYPKKLAEKLNK